MAWSRITPTGAAPTAQSAATTPTLTSSAQQSSSFQQGTTQSTTTTSGSKSGQSSTQNMDPSSLAALQSLISQLMAGGTAEQRKASATRDQEIAAVRGQRVSYSKEAAFADAEGAMNARVADVLRQLLPGLTRASEGAGASKGALQALAIQEAANRAAQDAASLGLQSAVQYGGISANLSGVLEGLTRQTDPVTQALIAALNVAKGAVQNSQFSENFSSTSSTSGTTSQTGSSSQSGTTSQQGQEYRTPVGGTAQNTALAAPATGPQFFGPVQTSVMDIPNNLWSADLAAALDNSGGWGSFSFKGI